MATIIYVEHDGARHEQQVNDGWSVMEGAVKNGVPGIDADCGGAAACATCHVYVNSDWLDAIGERTEQEVEMLNFAENVESNSRLSCQIQVSPALDGLTVTMPESQH